MVITDESGNDVTYMYKINGIYGILKVLPREITITAASAEVSYGSVAQIDGYTITSAYESALADGQTETVTVEGSQTQIGYSANVIKKVVIKDSEGNDVTSQYKIILVDGVLKVTP